LNYRDKDTKLKANMQFFWVIFALLCFITGELHPCYAHTTPYKKTKQLHQLTKPILRTMVVRLCLLKQALRAKPY